MIVDTLEPTGWFLKEVLGFSQTGEYTFPDNPSRRAQIYSTGPGGLGAEVHVEVRPDLPPARVGVGGVHHVAWRTPRVRELNQFRLTDGALTGGGFGRFREFQSGLLFRSRRPKPSFRTFPNPFVISGGLLWGQVRRGGRHLVSIQFRAQRGGSFGGGFRTIKRVRTDARGYFRTRVRLRRGQYRFTSSRGTSGTITRG